MRPAPWTLALALSTVLAACGKPAEQAKAPSPADQATAAAGALEKPELTVRTIMDTLVDPAGDYLFESVQDISDDKGVHRKEPRTDAEWAEVARNWQVLHDAPRLLIQQGRRAGDPSVRPAHPEVENAPEEIQRLMDSERADWIIRAQRLKDAADAGLKATAARDVPALSAALLGLDKACESCHLHYFYPRDQRAHQAAKEDGVIE